MDMLVRLYDLPPMEEDMKKLEADGIRVIRALPPNREHIVQWIKENSSLFAAGEAECAFSHSIPSIFVALDGNRIAGYACYNATAPDFFGPMKVHESYQKRGIGKVLLLACLHALAQEGYAYAVIGSVGPVEFYQKTVNAEVIENSTPGIYGRMFRPDE